MLQDKRILRETKACETVAGLEKRCLASTEYQLLQYTEINVCESVEVVGTTETLLRLRVLDIGVLSRQISNFYNIQKSMLLKVLLL